MSLTHLAISRPVLTLMVISAMGVLGLISFGRLNAELYPKLNTPVVTITMTYSGAPPEDVERLITRPIEDAVIGIANLDFVTSSSSEGRSRVSLTFTDAADVDVAANDVDRR